MARRSALAQLLSHREPTLLVAGQTVSAFGDGVANVALTLLVLDTSNNSAGRLSWFVAARMIPFVGMLLIGGAVVDRVSRRALMLISDAVRAALTGALTAIIVLGELRYWELIVFAVVFGLFDALFTPAMGALVPEIVPENLLGAMNSVRPLAFQLMGGMIGPAVGGLLAAKSLSVAIGADAATFALSALALAAMRPTPKPTRASQERIFHDIAEGLRFVRSRTWMWASLLSVSLMNALLFSPMSVLVPILLRRDMHTSQATVGYVFATTGLSGALGGLIASNLKAPRRRIRTMWGYWVVGGLTTLVLAVATSPFEVAAVALVVMPMMVLGNVIWETMVQQEVPTQLLGRVGSVDWFLSLGLAPLGVVIAGLISGAIGVRAYYLVFALATAIPGIAILLSSSANAVDRGRVLGHVEPGCDGEGGSPNT